MKSIIWRTERLLYVMFLNVWGGVLDNNLCWITLLLNKTFDATFIHVLKIHDTCDWDSSNLSSKSWLRRLSLNFNSWVTLSFLLLLTTLFLGPRLLINFFFNILHGKCLGPFQYISFCTFGWIFWIMALIEATVGIPV